MLAVPEGGARVRQVLARVAARRVAKVVCLEEDVLHNRVVRELAEHLRSRPRRVEDVSRGQAAASPAGKASVSASQMLPSTGVEGAQCGKAATPALIPQIDRKLRTGGSLYAAM